MIPLTGLMSERLIPALDVMTADEALAWTALLRDQVSMFKIGLRLFIAAGPDLVRSMRAEGHRAGQARLGHSGVEVFLDLKLHDIPSTVEAAAAAAAELDVAMMTVHASGGSEMIRAAVEGCAGRSKIIAVTVLTSLDAQRQNEIFGGNETSTTRVRRWATMAIESGADGVVCSPAEIEPLRASLPRTIAGNEPIIVTPGIRASDHPSDDQARTATAADAIRRGASHIVVGRPILNAADPKVAKNIVAKLLEEMESAG